MWLHYCKFISNSKYVIKYGYIIASSSNNVIKYGYIIASSSRTLNMLLNVVTLLQVNIKM